MIQRVKIFKHWAEKFAKAAQECIGGDADLMVSVPCIWGKGEDVLKEGCCASVVDKVRKQKVDLWLFYSEETDLQGKPDGYFFKDYDDVVPMEKNKEATTYWIDDYFYRLYRRQLPTGLLFINAISLSEDFAHIDDLAERMM